MLESDLKFNKHLPLYYYININSISNNDYSFDFSSDKYFEEECYHY
jgi:hypothetical protein